MNNEKQQQLEYMLKRSLGIILTDRKKIVNNASSVQYDAVNEELIDSVIFYQPFLLAFNAIRMADSFDKWVWGTISKHKSIHNKCVAKQAKKSVNGKTKPIQTRWNANDLVLLYLVVEEYLSHIIILIEFLENEAIEYENKNLTSILGKLKEIEKKTRKTWKHEKSELEIPTEKTQNEIKKLKKSFQDLITNKAILNDRYAEHHETTKPIYEELFLSIRIFHPILEWRQKYTSLKVGLGEGERLFKLDQSRSAPHLFELWCFFEISSRLAELGHEDIIQNSLLKGSDDDPFAKFSNSFDVYFNFYGNGVVNDFTQIFNDTHVEWFFKNPNELENSIVMDTKFKRPQTQDHYKVLGYMKDFNVNRGTVVFSNLLKLKPYKTKEKNERFVLQHLQNDEWLCAMSLIPNEQEQEHNKKTIDQFIEKMLLMTNQHATVDNIRNNDKPAK